MSNATDTPNKSGQRRRRRSRSGSNQNRNQNQNRDQNRDQGHSNRSHDGNKSSEGRPKRRRSRSRKPPVKLSFWQKLLVVIGLKEDPNKRKGGKFDAKSDNPQAGEKAAHTPKSGSARPPRDSSARQPKSNTRNARSKDDSERSTSDNYSKQGNRENRDKRRKGGDPSTVQSGRVYVGNLSYDITEQDLKELFKGVGTVRHVEIAYNHNTHRSKGYGFVEMMNKDDAMRSVEVLHDQPFMGRNMTVSGAKNKNEEADDDFEPTMEIKASDVALAPLPESSDNDTETESSSENSSEPIVEATDESAAIEAAAPQEPALSESSEEERKQD